MSSHENQHDRDQPDGTHPGQQSSPDLDDTVIIASEATSQPGAVGVPDWRPAAAPAVRASGPEGPPGLTGPPGGPPALPAGATGSWSSPQPWVRPGWQTDRRDPGIVIQLLAWGFTLVTLGYFLPWAVAASRGRSNQAAIGLLNFFLGWTVIGWIAALVMACQSHQPVHGGSHTTVVLAPHFPAGTGHPVAPQRPGPSWYPAPDGMGQQYWDGSAWTIHRAP